MSTPASPVDQIKTELNGFGDDLVELGVYGIGIGAAVLLVRKGWKVVRGFF